MSSHYTAEPPTEGGITLHTTHGALHIRLWPRDAPGAVRTFVQLALDGRYTGIPFHRIVPGLLVQSGDTSRTNKLRQNILAPSSLRAERNSRLKFRRRALVAMVADDVKDDGDDGDVTKKGGEKRVVGRNKHMGNDNSERMIQDQFFITLAEAPFLNGQHPIIGTVVGNSVFNLLNIASSHVASAGDDHDDDDVKSCTDDLPRITKVEVTENPFLEMKKTISVSGRDDVIGETELKGMHEGKEHERRRRGQTDARRAVRSDRLLSFRTSGDDDNSEEKDEDEDEDEDEESVIRNDSGARLSAAPPRRKRVRPAVGASLPATILSSSTASAAVMQSTQAIPATGRVTLSPVSPTPPSQPVSKQDPQSAHVSQTASVTPPITTADKKEASSLIEAANAEFEALRKKLMSSSENDNNPKREPSPCPSVQKEERKEVTNRLVGKRRRSRKAEEEMLARLRAFEARLLDSRKASASTPSTHGAATSGAAWFVRGLKLGPPSDDERDYEMVDSMPRTRTREHSRSAKR